MQIDKNNLFQYPQPDDENIRVWRFFDFPKFISFLEKRQLYLCRVDLLQDPHEGSITTIDDAILKKAFEISGKPDWGLEFGNFRQLIRKYTYVNCWHMNNKESLAMWLLYCGANQGVAIRTTYKKLRDCIHDDQMAIGLIRYIDHELHPFGFDKKLFTIAKKNQQYGYEGYYLHGPFMHKMEAFAHEKEVRIVKTLFDQIENVTEPENQEPGPQGITLDVPLESLVENIYVHPYSQEWYFEIVKSIVSKYGPKMIDNVERSPMRKEPTY